MGTGFASADRLEGSLFESKLGLTAFRRKSLLPWAAPVSRLIAVRVRDSTSALSSVTHTRRRALGLRARLGTSFCDPWSFSDHSSGREPQKRSASVAGTSETDPEVWPPEESDSLSPVRDPVDFICLLDASVYRSRCARSDPKSDVPCTVGLPSPSKTMGMSSTCSCEASSASAVAPLRLRIAASTSALMGSPMLNPWGNLIVTSMTSPRGLLMRVPPGFGSQIDQSRRTTS